jgi:hypothetical protein
VNYGLDNGVIVIRTAAGTKLAAARTAGALEERFSSPVRCGPDGAWLAGQAQGGRGDRSEYGPRDIGSAAAAPTVPAVVHPRERQLDIGEGLPGAGDHHRADLIESSDRAHIHRARPVPGQRTSVLTVRDEMSKLLIAEVALPLEFFAQVR